MTNVQGTAIRTADADKLPKLGIGIDVGGTKIWAALGTEGGRILDERIVNTPREREAFLSQINAIIGEWMNGGLSGIAGVSGIGIGLPGHVEGNEVRWVPNLSELNGFALAEAMRGVWNVPVWLQNDGKLALIGEQWIGAAAGCRNVMMMVVGTGIGGGIMVDGRLLEGAHGTAGSLGWMTLDLADGGDREHGWLERMFSGTAINRRSSQLSGRPDSRIMFDLARQGDEEALVLVREIGYSLGTAIANMASMLDLELAVIAGGLSRQLDLLLPAIADAVAKYASPAARSIRIAPAQLLDRAGVVGALRLSFTNSLL